MATGTSGGCLIFIVHTLEKSRVCFSDFVAHLCILACILWALVASEQAGPNLPSVALIKIWMNVILLEMEMPYLHHCGERQIRPTACFWLPWSADGLCLMILQAYRGVCTTVSIQFAVFKQTHCTATLVRKK